MSKHTTFQLPDLGEGLPDATIVEWYVKEGDSVALDAPLVSMETAKAVVEVPSPVSGKVVRLAGEAGAVVVTGHMLAEFELDPDQPQRAQGQDTGHHQRPAAKAVASDDGGELAVQPGPSEARGGDAGTVVGAVHSSDTLHRERAVAVGGVKAMPAVRALARKLGVDLARVRASGPDGTVTQADVKRAAADPATLLAPPPSHAPPRAAGGAGRTALSAAGKPMRTRPPGDDASTASGQPEQLKGVRRNMARVMADAHAQVVPTTVVDDADLHAWVGRQDITARLIRAIVAGARAMPALNAWFDGQALTVTRHQQVDIGIAMDTADGLFVPALRNADMLDPAGIRAGIERLRSQVGDRSIPASELSGHTISLSNFGMFAGRYATPVVVPPCVAIVGAGRLSHDVVAVMGGIEVHRRLPISLSFDHRAATGGEAVRFLRALLDDLELPH
ncbi:dihydrolipoamide acetyltransferase family protein [Pseudoxanthomonas koreensis]|uniref:dihydrolipoamide acetyltransferase family protein n=1 Tax=Pseudoxanthomonas koreensis TaxID=266061 RepID=UPI0035A6883F